MEALISTTSPQILLVEDDATSCLYLKTVLESFPAIVHTAKTVHAALSFTSNEQPNLCLIDINLPDGNGLDLLHTLQQRYPSIAAIAHTADDRQETHQALINAGFYSVLTKPITGKELLNAVRRAILHPNNVQLANDNLPDWDHAIALAALNGQKENVAALRKLFIMELPSARDGVIYSLQRDQPETARAHLHQLQASCGFVGATRLQKIAYQLHADIENPQLLQDFREAVQVLFQGY